MLKNTRHIQNNTQDISSKNNTKKKEIKKIIDIHTYLLDHYILLRSRASHPSFLKNLFSLKEILCKYCI